MWNIEGKVLYIKWSCFISTSSLLSLILRKYIWYFQCDALFSFFLATFSGWMCCVPESFDRVEQPCFLWTQPHFEFPHSCTAKAQSNKRASWRPGKAPRIPVVIHQKEIRLTLLMLQKFGEKTTCYPWKPMKNGIFYDILHISTGVGFLPSTESQVLAILNSPTIFQDWSFVLGRALRKHQVSW